jgi:hypothetical protein
MKYLPVARLRIEIHASASENSRQVKLAAHDYRGTHRPEAPSHIPVKFKKIIYFSDKIQIPQTGNIQISQTGPAIFKFSVPIFFCGTTNEFKFVCVTWFKY